LLIKEDFLLEICNFLKKQTHLQYKILIDIVAVDYPSYKKRFHLIYNLLSVSFNERIFIKCSIQSFKSLYSITSVFSAAG
jgi:NADH:ubiquinone oxidoreductase subunit C